jgi:hypothetical protein
MPVATVNTQDTTRFPLETLEGGYVELRRMSYGEFLKRRDMISKMSFEGDGKDTKGFMEMAQEKVTQFEFQSCIVDHNLEEEGGKKLDFRTTRAIQILDPRVGEEISEIIDDENKFTGRDKEGNKSGRVDPLGDSSSEYDPT